MDNIVINVYYIIQAFTTRNLGWGLVVPSMVVQKPDVETVEARPFLRSEHSHGKSLYAITGECAKGFKRRTAKAVESTWAKTIADKSQ